jgi:hypothetical protein
MLIAVSCASKKLFPLDSHCFLRVCPSAPFVSFFPFVVEWSAGLCNQPTTSIALLLFCHFKRRVGSWAVRPIAFPRAAKKTFPFLRRTSRKGEKRRRKKKFILPFSSGTERTCRPCCCLRSLSLAVKYNISLNGG